MLTGLSVRNIVLIDQVDLELEAGLTVLTGETGAGKSIMLDALTLALGGRGDAALVRVGAESGQVVAVFHLPAGHPARALLVDSAISAEDELILKRVQFADGRTRAFINDQPVSATLLQQIGRQMVEIHGQHDDRALVDAATHRAALDSFGGHLREAEAVAIAYAALVDARESAAAQRAAVAEAAARESFARHVVEELSALAPAAGEEETLTIRRQRLMALEKAAEDIREADDVLGGPAAPGATLAALARRLTRKVDAGSSLYAPVVEALDRALVALDETDSALTALKREMEFDSAELESVEQRLFALRGAARKHQVLADDLAGVLARYQADLEALESGEAALTRFDAAAATARAAYDAAATRLAAARTKTAKALAKAVEAELPDLKLGSARFLVDQQSDTARVAASGYDNIVFHVQANPGSLPGPLLKVASGGELSRFLLALKVVLADRGSAPVLVFDEIDTGVGGAVADAIGRRLARLAEGVQVLAVTHAPQVAARAQQHLLIEKETTSRGTATRTGVRPLEGGTRREEVARMLAGATITDEARAAAARLLSEVN